MNKKKVFVVVVLGSLLVSSCHRSYDSSFEYVIKNNTAMIISHQENAEELSVIIPEELDGMPVTVLGSDAFYQHKSIESITLPESMLTIEGSPFYRCSSLKALHIPLNVKQIDSNPVFRCKSLMEITVDSNNTSFTAVDGVLFDKEMTQLIAYPEGKTDEHYIVPKSIEKLPIDAFGYHPNLKHLTILANVKEFPDENMFVFPDDITLYIEAGSAAEQYAKRHHLRFEVI